MKTHEKYNYEKNAAPKGKSYMKCIHVYSRY